MGGVPDIGAIPCHVFSKMLVIGPKGTRLSLLTWAAGYFNARTGKNIDEVLNSKPASENPQDFFSVTDHFVNYCAANPDAQTRDAVVSLGQNVLGVS